MTIVVVDYGCGNPASISNMLQKLNEPALVTSNPDDVRKADRIILPGVGAFDYGAESIRRLGIAEALADRVLKDGVPILGICIGFQLLARGSEEGVLPGLGWIEGDVVAFDKSRLKTADKIPHMGWSDLSVLTASALLSGFHESPRFYFVHSFHMQCDHEDDIAATARHGYDFCAAVERNNILGVQFHPEKSHQFGMKLLQNFLSIRQ